jgi:UDP-2-acetamido-2-deoxy-ribo-hexuluronate aminotransferase
MALEIGPGDEVITTPFSFFATAETMILLGAVPIFVDIDPKTYNINPALIEAAITPRTKAILPVSLYGQCADFTAINAIAERHGLPVIEDGAQSFGGSYQGRMSCGLSTIGCTSFFPSKPLGCYGDGGACFTNDDKLAQTMSMIRNHGQEKRYYHTMIGVNARFDTLQAAILLAKLDVFAEELKKRQIVADWYASYLNGQISIPYIAPGNFSAYAQYSIQVEQRDAVQLALQTKGIPTAVHYPQAIYQQPAIRPYLQQENIYCPETEAAASRVISLPFHPYLTKQSVEMICRQLLNVVGESSLDVVERYSLG